MTILVLSQSHFSSFVSIITQFIHEFMPSIKSWNKENTATHPASQVSTDTRGAVRSTAASLPVPRLGCAKGGLSVWDKRRIEIGPTASLAHSRTEDVSSVGSFVVVQPAWVIRNLYVTQEDFKNVLCYVKFSEKPFLALWYISSDVFPDDTVLQVGKPADFSVLNTVGIVWDDLKMLLNKILNKRSGLFLDM